MSEQNVVSPTATEGRNLRAGKCARTLFASIEAIIVVLAAVGLYFWGAIYFASKLYCNEIRGTCERAAILWRARVHGNVAPARGTGARADELLDRGPAGRGRYNPHVN